MRIFIIGSVLKNKNNVAKRRLAISKLHSKNGFSIIELLIILLVMSLAISGVAIVINSASSVNKEMDDEGKNLYNKMLFARDEALIQQYIIGLHISKDVSEKNPSSIFTYYWSRYQSERWIPLSEPLGTTTLDREITLDATFDNALLDDLLTESLNNSDDVDDVSLPVVIFYPNSDFSDFNIIFSIRDDKESNEFRIFRNERGQLEHSAMLDNTNP